MRSAIMFCVLAAACGTDPMPTSPFVPGLQVDSRGGSIITARIDGGQPCGFETEQSSSSSDGPSYHSRSTGQITYDAAGRDILEVETDDRGGVIRSEAEYDASGKPTHWHVLWDDGQVNDSWQAYDSFGRLVRSESDNNGNQIRITTYAYGDRNLRTSAHSVSYTNNGAPSYDRAYTYDAMDRLTQLDRDNGFDGTIDESDRYDYDDVARTATMDTVDPTGKVIAHSDFTYDAEGHIKREDAWSDGAYVGTSWHASSTRTDEYDSGQWVRMHLDQHGEYSDGRSDESSYEYGYRDSCN